MTLKQIWAPFYERNNEDVAAAAVLQQVLNDANIIALELPTLGYEEAFTRQDGVRIVWLWVMFPLDGGEPGWRGRADVKYEVPA